MGSPGPELRISDLAATLFTERLDVETTLEAVIAAARDALDADRASLYMVTDDLRIGGVHTTEADPVVRERLHALRGRGPHDLPIWRALVASEDPVVAIPDVGASPDVGPDLAHTIRAGASLAVRLTHRDCPDGSEPELAYLAITWSEPRAIGERERRMALALAGLAASAIATARLKSRAESLLRRARNEREAVASAERVARLGAWTWSIPEGRLTWSEQVYRTMGVEPSAAMDLATFEACVHSDDRDAVHASCLRLRETGEPYRIQHRVVRPDGEERVLVLTGEADAFDASGRPLRCGGTVHDITERVRAEATMRMQARLLDAVDAGVIATDLAGTVIHWNRAAEQLYGWTREEAMGQPIMELTVGPRDADAAAEAMREIVATGRWEGEFPVMRKDGTSFPAYVRNAIVSDEDGEPVGVIGVSVDISARVEMEERLRAANAFLATVTNSMGDGMITLDGDRCVTSLNPAAERLTGWPAAEIVGRPMHQVLHFRRPDGSPYPEDECELLRERPDGEVVTGEDEMFIRRDGQDLYVSCTSAPFSTEETGSGWVVVFSDSTERHRREEAMRRDLQALTWADRIRGALATEGLVLHAQPIVDLASGRVVQHELLVRMRADDGSLVPPGRFLPTAEKHGLIGDLDRWVVRRSARLASQGHPVEFNLSATSIGEPGFASVVERALGEAGADPRLLVIELTETALLRDEAAAEAFIARVRRLGCRVALDDFGTGYGGFRYLKQLPVDYLKIDIEFVRDLCVNPASRHVVEAVVSLARAFGQRTVAEGVEHMQTLRRLRELGVDMAQGYGIGRPKPVAKAFDPERIAGAEARVARGRDTPEGAPAP